MTHTAKSAITAMMPSTLSNATHHLTPNSIRMPMMTAAITEMRIAGWINIFGFMSVS